MFADADEDTFESFGGKKATSKPVETENLPGKKISLSTDPLSGLTKPRKSRFSNKPVEASKETNSPSPKVEKIKTKDPPSPVPKPVARPATPTQASLSLLCSPHIKKIEEKVESKLATENEEPKPVMVPIASSTSSSSSSDSDSDSDSSSTEGVDHAPQVAFILVPPFSHFRNTQQFLFYQKFSTFVNLGNQKIYSFFISMIGLITEIFVHLFERFSS